MVSVRNPQKQAFWGFLFACPPILSDWGTGLFVDGSCHVRCSRHQSVEALSHDRRAGQREARNHAYPRAIFGGDCIRGVMHRGNRSACGRRSDVGQALWRQFHSCDAEGLGPGGRMEICEEAIGRLHTWGLLRLAGELHDDGCGAQLRAVDRR